MSEQTNQSTFTDGTTIGATGYTTGYTTTLEDSTLFATRDSTDISNIDDTRLDMNIEHRENPWESPTKSLLTNRKVCVILANRLGREGTPKRKLH